MTLNELELALAKFYDAVSDAYNDEAKNIHGLSVSEITKVCEPKMPNISGGSVIFDDKDHEKMWEIFINLSTNQIVDELITPKIGNWNLIKMVVG